MLKSTIFAIKLGRYFGLFPVKIMQINNSNNNRNNIKFVFSKYLSIYSLLLMAICVGINVYTLYFDIKRYDLDRSFHMKSITALIATCIETATMTLYMVVNVIINNMYCMDIFHYEKTISFHNYLFTSNFNTENLWYKVILFTVIWMNVVLICDLIVWYLTTGDIIANIPYHIITMTLIIFMAHFLTNVLNIGVHFQYINDFLIANLPKNDSLHYLQIKLSESKTFITASSAQSLTIPMLSDLHWMLCGAVQTTNAIFGGQLLAAMLCIFVHIIITPYFFFLDILYPSSTGFLNVSYLAVQSLWIVTHIMELVLLVLPCAATTHQANKTSTIICKLLNKEMSSETRKQLETFVIQLIHHNAEFSACGLFRLNLPVITSVAGAVTTYLVILIQFQNSDTTTLLGNT